MMRKMKKNISQKLYNQYNNGQLKVTREEKSCKNKKRHFLSESENTKTKKEKYKDSSNFAQSTYPLIQRKKSAVNRFEKIIFLTIRIKVQIDGRNP